MLQVQIAHAHTAPDLLRDFLQVVIGHVEGGQIDQVADLGR